MSGVDIVVAAKAALTHLKANRDALVECNTLRRADGRPDMRTLPRDLRSEVRLLDKLISAIEGDR